MEKERVWTNKEFGDLNLHEKNGLFKFQDGNKEWFKDGLLHRLDGPAVEYDTGSKEWYKDGEPHRLDGPAIEYVDGKRIWYKEGKLHRLDGPAIEYPDGGVDWWIEDKQYSYKEWKKLSYVILNNLDVFL